MKRALVLSGGGSRGAYECGAWQALKEMNIRLDAVYGTSIGAINAALVAQGDLDRCVRLWNTITLNQIIALDEDEDFNIDHMLHSKRDIIPFLVENAKNLRMDITPLENLVRESIDEGRVRASGMELGIMVTHVPVPAGVPMRLEDIPRGQLGDHLIASASCFPVFPVKNIGSERYIDGGFADNLPVGMALEDGADEVIAIDIHPQFTHPEYANLPCLTVVHPLNDLGPFLDFSREVLDRSRRMGYYDTMKIYGRFDGVRYTFSRVSDLKIAPLARGYVQRLARLDAKSTARGGDAFLSAALCADSPLKKLDWKNAFLRGLELCAQSLGFREDAIYEIDTLTGRALSFVREAEAGSFSEAARGGSRRLIAHIFSRLQTEPDYAENNLKRLSDYPMETAAALYLDFIYRKL